MQNLLKEIKNCRVCQQYLECGPNPVLNASISSKIIIIGQAPGRIVHNSGVPWEDKSGDNLRSWMGIDKQVFYDESQIGIVPMGFCYPGKGKSGDLPPRPECAPLWHEKLLNKMPSVALTILIGQYAQNYYLPESKKSTLTQRVQNFSEFMPQYFVLPHPSPRNFIWQNKNPWFESDVLPIFKSKIQEILFE